MENKIENKYGNVIVFETTDYKWGVKDINGKVIVPTGKYDWIDGFDHGLARVRTSGNIGYTRNTVFNIDSETGEIVTEREALIAIEEKNCKAHPEKFAKWGNY